MFNFLLQGVKCSQQISEISRMTRNYKEPSGLGKISLKVQSNLYMVNILFFNSTRTILSIHKSWIDFTNKATAA